MSNLAMHVTGVPAGLRVTQLPEAHVGQLMDLISAMELEFFGRSETNGPEVLGSLRAPELQGTRGTAGLWDDDRLVAGLLAYDGVRHERGVYLDLFVHPDAADRRAIATCLVGAAESYGRTLAGRTPSWMKAEAFAGDTDLEATFEDRGYEHHRRYLRMRLDFGTEPPSQDDAVTLRTWTPSDWRDLHEVVTASFADHYDFHPLPLDTFQQHAVNQTTDTSRWRLAFHEDRCVGVCIGSNRYAAHRLGYVETLGVLQEYRGRGFARSLLADAFSRDHAAGFTGTALHCDATNPTGATALYESLGMRKDQEYSAWRSPLGRV